MTVTRASDPRAPTQMARTRANATLLDSQETGVYARVTIIITCFDYRCDDRDNYFWRNYSEISVCSFTPSLFLLATFSSKYVHVHKLDAFCCIYVCK